MTIEDTSSLNLLSWKKSQNQNDATSEVVIDLRSIKFPNKNSVKNVKDFLFRLIRKHQNKDEVILKISTSYASIYKYAINTGFKIKEAGLSETIWSYRPADSSLFQKLTMETRQHKKKLKEKGLVERANGINLKLFELGVSKNKNIDLTPFNKREMIPTIVLNFDISEKSTIITTCPVSSNNKNEDIEAILDIRLYPALKNLLKENPVEAFLGTKQEMEAYYRKKGVNILYEFQIPSSATYFLAESNKREQFIIMAGLVGKDNLIAQMLTLKYAGVYVENIEIIGTFNHFTTIVNNDLDSLFKTIPEIETGMNVLIIAGCDLKTFVNNILYDKYSDQLGTSRSFSGDIISLIYTPIKNSQNNIQGFITLDLNYGEIVESILLKILSKSCIPYIFSGGACGYIPQDTNKKMPEIGTRISVMKSMNEAGEFVSSTDDCKTVHLQVPSIFIETYKWLESAKKRGSTVDIETFYMLRALQTHKSNGLYPIVSDLGCFVSDWVGEKPLREYSNVFKYYPIVLGEFLDRISLIETSRTYNPMLQKQHDICIDSLQTDPKVPHLSMMNSSFLTTEFNKSDQVLFQKSILQLNPTFNLKNLFYNKKWDLDFFKSTNIPVVLGAIKNKELFSHKKNGIGLRFLDMPIHMPDYGWRIPTDLKQFSEVIDMAVKYERITNPNFDKLNYVYITVDQGVVEPKKAQRRIGWHGDSFLPIDTRIKEVDITCDRVYVIADSCPTPFVPGPFSFEGVNVENWNEISAYLEKTANNITPQFSPLFILLRLDPYCIHNVGFNNVDNAVFRTFVKISFSEREYRHLGNCHNPLFIYDWPMVPRKNTPYSNKVLKQSAHREDRDSFRKVNPYTIDFSKDKTNTDWTKQEIFSAIKQTKIHAIPVIEGLILHTFDGDFLETILVSKKGDWKVTTKKGINYFLSMEKLHQFYNEDPKQSGTFISKPIKRRMVELTENVRIYTPWETLQYAQKGDYLCHVNDEYYIIPKMMIEDFKRTS